MDAGLIYLSGFLSGVVLFTVARIIWRKLTSSPLRGFGLTPSLMTGRFAGNHLLLPLPVLVQPAGRVFGPLPLPQSGLGLSLKGHPLEFLTARVSSLERILNSVIPPNGRDTDETPRLIGLLFGGLSEALLRCKRLKGFRCLKTDWAVFCAPSLKGEA